MENETAVVKSASMSLKQVTDRVNLVHQVLEKVMKKNTHYGTVPGCGAKMVLLKPGADVLAMTFRLVPQFAISRNDLTDGHREYDVTCSMYGAGGELLGQGVGSASTMEKKYRYRWEGDGHNRKKIENEDIADVYNTVLKIAKKRAHIDATLTVTGAADLFTQDLIDEDEAPTRPPVKMPTETAPAVDGAQVVVGVITDITTKQGTGAKGPWTAYNVFVGKDRYSTFSESIGFEATENKGQSVRIEYTVNAKGYNEIVSLTPEHAASEPGGDDAEIRKGYIRDIMGAAMKSAKKYKAACERAGYDPDAGAALEMQETAKLAEIAQLCKA